MILFFAAGVFIALAVFRLSKRMTELQSVVADLNGRVARLEQLRTRADRVADAPPPAPRPSAPPPALTRPVPPPVAVPAAATPHTAGTLETRIGARWLLYVGIAAIVIGVAYFEKLAIENHWISDTARVLQGGLLGVVFVVAGLRFAKAGYRLYGQLLSGCGFAVLYVVMYAAFNLYHLVAQTPAFALMSVNTLAAAWLADRDRSQGLAIVAVVGGFATPFLLGSGKDAEVALFGYTAILIAGTMLLSRRREWPALNVLSYVFTLFTVGAWAATFYADSKYLTTEIFLTIFCAMFSYGLFTARPSPHPAALAERFVLSSAPVLYHLASLYVLSPHSMELLVYFVVMTAIGVFAAVRGGSWLRLTIFAAIALPFLMWSGTRPLTHSWIRGGVVAWAAVYLLNLAGVIETSFRDQRRFSIVDAALLHANSLATFAGIYLVLESAGWQRPAAPLLAAFQAIPLALTWRRDRERSLHFAVVAFALAAVALAQLADAAWITAGWAAEGVALIVLGHTWRRRWLRWTGVAAFGLALVQLVHIQFSDPLAGQLLLLNPRAAVGAFLIALTYGVTWVFQHRGDSDHRPLEVGIALVVAKLQILSLAASEIVAYWNLHSPAPLFEPASQLVIAGVLMGAVIVALGLRRGQEWMRGIGALVLAASAYTLFVLQLGDTPEIYQVVFNSRSAAGVVAVLTLYALARLHREWGTAVKDVEVDIVVLTTSASLLTLSLVTSEISAYWRSGTASMTHDALQAIAWAGVGGFLVWRGVLSRYLTVRIIGGLLLGVALTRLFVAQFMDPDAGYLIVFNARVMAALLLAAVLFGLARIYERASEVPEARYGMAALRLLANVIGLTLFTSEITAYWRLQDLRGMAAADSSGFFAREMMLSITWAIYATVLIVVGLWKRYAPIRYFAMAVFAVTILKVFVEDLAELDRLYRVASIIGLGVLLLVTAFLYQRLRGGDNVEARR